MLGILGGVAESFQSEKQIPPPHVAQERGLRDGMTRGGED